MTLQNFNQATGRFSHVHRVRSLSLYTHLDPSIKVNHARSRVYHLKVTTSPNSDIRLEDKGFSVIISDIHYLLDKGLQLHYHDHLNFDKFIVKFMAYVNKNSSKKMLIKGISFNSWDTHSIDHAKNAYVSDYKYLHRPPITVKLDL